MNNQPSDDSEMPSSAELNELIARMRKMKDTLAEYAAGMNPRELKHIRSEADMIKKMPFVKKALDLAFEHQELITPEFLEKFWEDHARYLIMKDLYESSKKLKERLEEICPETAKIPYKTDSTTNSV
jgi:hypothetical protein